MTAMERDMIREANARLRDDNLRLRMVLEYMEANARGFAAMHANIVGERDRLKARVAELEAATARKLKRPVLNPVVG